MTLTTRSTIGTKYTEVSYLYMHFRWRCFCCWQILDLLEEDYILELYVSMYNSAIVTIVQSLC